MATETVAVDVRLSVDDGGERKEEEVGMGGRSVWVVGKTEVVA
jgi:hypothetical protein